MNVFRLTLVGAALACALMQSGCATVTRGTTEQLMIQSEPSAAQVRLSNGFTGVTPVAFKVPRKGDVIVTVTKEGYEPAEVTVRSQLSGAGTAGFLGNALIGGIIGGGVDVATGATLAHTPNPVVVTLRPVEPLPPAAPAEEVAESPVAESTPPAPSEAVENETPKP